MEEKKGFKGKIIKFKQDDNKKRMEFINVKKRYICTSIDGNSLYEYYELQ